MTLTRRGRTVAAMLAVLAALALGWVTTGLGTPCYVQTVQEAQS